MKIGILGTGSIGATLTRRLSAAGHEVVVANSRGPQTISAELLADGARAVEAAGVVEGVEALVLSIPLARVPDVAPLVARLPEGAVVLDTSNYYPARDGRIAALEDGQVESRWVVDQLGGRPVVKAWNAVTAGSFADRAAPAGSPGRIALPVAADTDGARALGLSLVDQTGFDGLDAGTLDESWRQQPGTPAYCTDLTRDELGDALAAARPGRAPRRRDLAVAVATELLDDPGRHGGDLLVRINRLIYGG